MKDLNESREKINMIDKEMAKLFCDRMSFCKDIAEFKKANSMPIHDANREETVINNNLSFIDNEDIKPYYINFIKGLLNISKEYQRSLLTGLRIAYSGIEGAYGYIAASRMYPKCELVSNSNFSKAFST